MRLRLLALSLLLLGIATAVIQAQSSVVPQTKAVDTTLALTAHDLAPPACAAIALTTVFYGDGDLAAPGINQLILGGPAAQVITGTPGDDCIVGGAGADTLKGNGGNDV